MKTSETACFTICASAACINNRRTNLNAEVVQLAASIMENFEELGI
jgi:hypothetical protein